MKKICIYCGSSMGSEELFRTEARNVGKFLAKSKFTIVYGGSDIGLMGEIANAALEEHGEVIGVIPRTMHEKVGHTGLTELHIVDTMHQRKNLMFELSDGFIAIPGGLGTLDEVFEMLTWGQLGFHQKPCGFLNVGNYYDNLFAFLDTAVEKMFIKKVHREMIIQDNSIENLIDKFKNFKPDTFEKCH